MPTHAQGGPESLTITWTGGRCTLLLPATVTAEERAIIDELLRTVQGRIGGAEGLRKYCRSQAIVSARIQPRSEPQWYPYGPVKGQLISRLAGFSEHETYGAGYRRHHRAPGIDRLQDADIAEHSCAAAVSQGLLRIGRATDPSPLRRPSPSIVAKPGEELVAAEDRSDGNSACAGADPDGSAAGRVLATLELRFTARTTGSTLTSTFTKTGELILASQA